MSLSLNRVHVFARRKNERGETVTQLIRTDLYTRLSSQGEPPVFLQGGRFYSEGGDEYLGDQLPGWVEIELQKLNPSVLEECGFFPTGEKQPDAEVYEFPEEAVVRRQTTKKYPKKLKLKKETASGFRRKGW